MEKQEKRTNLCAELGFLSTLFNLVVSSAFIMTGSKNRLLIFASATAVISLIFSVFGKVNAGKAGKGNFLSKAGILANVLILAILAVYCGVTIF